MLAVEYQYNVNVDDKYQELVREVNGLRGELPEDIYTIETGDMCFRRIVGVHLCHIPQQDVSSVVAGNNGLPNLFEVLVIAIGFYIK